MDEMDEYRVSPSAAGKYRSYPKHRAQHLASAAPYRAREPYRGPPAARDVGRRVYVGNLAWDVKSTNLMDHMRLAGEVEQCEVLTEPSGRSKGCGLVTFRTHDMAMNAIERLTDTELMGRKIFVREDREENNQKPPRSLPPQSSSYMASSVYVSPPTSGYSNPFTPVSVANLNGGTRVYVGNLSWSVKWQDLKDHMKQAGNVLHADVLEEPNGRSKGCGIVEYDTPEAAARAIMMLTDSKLDNRPIFVREDREARPRHQNAPPASMPPLLRGGSGSAPPVFSRPPTLHSAPSQVHTMPGPPLCSIYIGNLPPEAMWQDVKDLVRTAASVDHVEVALHPDGRSKGYALVKCQTPQDAQNAIGQLHDTEFRGRYLEVRLDRPRL
ncbi:RNA binding protein [Thraustotheca clavata]|uniref:RNA binding protein n=1 Tax=Thraustotheca clavata TaxID=74557 RepID=A0A1V9ZAZ3_9STRA|nr:RNA binding protein [Thraustotheca clavata]